MLQYNEELYDTTVKNRKQCDEFMTKEIMLIQALVEEQSEKDGKANAEKAELGGHESHT